MSKSLPILYMLLSLGTAACASANVTSIAPPEYLDWLDDLKKEMVGRGISQETIDKVYAVDYYHPKPDAVKSDRKQIEFVLRSDEYLNRVVSKSRVEKGQKYYRELKPFWQKLEQKYAVPGEYLVAFWGIETNFGTNFGGHNVIDALTEMSYDTRRPKFFRNELYHALKIIDAGHIEFTEMQGSWAGAMGHFQFMPSTFNAYAVDFDGDKQINVWKSFDDAAASAANYLTAIGWQKNRPWGTEVRLPWNFDYSQADRAKFKTIREWRKLGVLTAAGGKIRLPDDAKAAIIVPEGRKGRAYLLTDNFYKIMQWNRSENYALAVGILADYIKSGKKWRKIRAGAFLRLNSEDIKKIQAFINEQKIARLQEDGKLGQKTRQAIKKLQKKAMLPQDGYPDYQLLRKIETYDHKAGFKIPVPERKLHKAK